MSEKYDKLAQVVKEKFDYGPADHPSQAFLNETLRRAREERAAVLDATKQQNPNSPKRRAVTSTCPRPSISTDFASNRFRTDIENVEQVYNRDPKNLPITIYSPFSPDSLRRSREERLAANGSQPSVTS